MLTKSKNFTGNEHPGGEQQGKETQENCSATQLAVSGFTATGLVSRLSLANHLAWPKFHPTPSPSWWPVPLSDKMDFSVRASGQLAGHTISSLLLALPNSPGQFWGAAPSSLWEPPVVRQFRQADIIVPCLGGRFWSTVPKQICATLSRVQLFATHGLQPIRSLCLWGFSGKNTGVSCHFLL